MASIIAWQFSAAVAATSSGQLGNDNESYESVDWQLEQLEQLLHVLHRDWHLPLSDTNRVGLGRIMKKLSVPSVRTKLGMKYRVARVAYSGK